MRMICTPADAIDEKSFKQAVVACDNGYLAIGSLRACRMRSRLFPGPGKGLANGGSHRDEEAALTQARQRAASSSRGPSSPMDYDSGSEEASPACGNETLGARRSRALC